MPEYLLPDVGEGLTEAEIVGWKVAVGDVVAINDVVVEIETAKSLVELPSPYSGTVTALLVKEGETVAVGTPIIAIGDAVAATGGAPVGDAPEIEIDLSNPAASGGGEGESLVGRMKAERGATRRARRKPITEAAGEHTARADVHDTFNQNVTHQHEQVQHLVSAVEHPGTTSDPVPPARSVVERPVTLDAGAVRALAKPPVRRLARELGVDLATITGTGPGGSVSRADVLEAHFPPSSTPGFSSDLTLTFDGGTAERPETREPVKGVRKMMAQAMVGSAFSAPHVTEWVTVDATATVELVARLAKRRELREVKISPLLVLAKACLLAIGRAPEINSWWDEQAQEVVYKQYVNLGIAAATPRGLVVPNVKGAERLGLAELAEALSQLTATARAGRTQPAEMSDGTFTITNVGVFGVDAGTPIINPGESAILCFGAIRKQPWVVTAPDGTDEIAVRHVTTLALSFDHRHIDGEKGSRFLADVAAILEDPGTALLY